MNVETPFYNYKMYQHVNKKPRFFIEAFCLIEFILVLIIQNNIG